MITIIRNGEIYSPDYLGKKDIVQFEDAIKVITSNVADNLKLTHKGRIEKDRDGDIVIVDKNSLEILHVIAKGKVMVSDREILVKGIFEK